MERSARDGLRRARLAGLALAALLAGCEGVTLEIIEPGLGDGGVGSPGAMGWEVRFDPVEGDGCPSPRGQRLGAVDLWVPAGAGVTPIDSITLAPGRYVVSAIGRDAECRALYFGRTCFGPDAPPRFLMVPTCEVGAASCVDFAWSDEDRAALACSSPCNAGRCE